MTMGVWRKDGETFDEFNARYFARIHADLCVSCNGLGARWDPYDDAKTAFVRYLSITSAVPFVVEADADFNVMPCFDCDGTGVHHGAR